MYLHGILSLGPTDTWTRGSYEADAEGVRRASSSPYVSLQRDGVS